MFQLKWYERSGDHDIYFSNNYQLGIYENYQIILYRYVILTLNDHQMTLSFFHIIYLFLDLLKMEIGHTWEISVGLIYYYFHLRLSVFNVKAKIFFLSS